MQRLKTRPQFQATMAGETVARTAHFALHRLVLGDAARASLEPGGPPLFGVPGVWLGAMTPKRCARRAVTRNAIRRQIYALGEQLDPPLTDQAYLIRLRAAYSPAQFPSARSEALRHAVRAELLQLFQRIQPSCAPR